MSTHACPVIEIENVLPHPNADRLEIVPIRGWQCVTQKGAFKPGDLAVYVEPDMMVPVTRDEFAFLKDPGKFDQTYARIRGKRLRGVMSYGLLIPAPSHYEANCDCAQCEVIAGDDMMEELGIHRWQPPEVSSMRSTQGFAMARANLPELSHFTTKFDLENWNNYPNVIDLDREHVVVTEKVHGANARYCWYQGDLYVGSRSNWLRRPTSEEMENGSKLDAWHKVADACPAIQHWCQRHPCTILYGEIYGNVQDLKYGMPNDIKFAGFAAYNTLGGQFVDTEDLFVSLDVHDVPRVPILASGKVSMLLLRDIAEADSTMPKSPVGHMREGIVITPINERWDPMVGRVSLKLISNRYWERKL